MHRVDHTKNILEVEDVSFSYGGKDVLKHASLVLHEGDYLGMVGPNGSGKTTLLKVMLGLLVPREGSVRIFGTDVKDFQDWNKIGYVPQKAVNFDANFPATVLEVVLMGRYGKRGLLRAVTNEDRHKALAALDHVGMKPFKDRLIGDLSGGQQQRVFIARALAGEPSVIFLDEPTSSVDASAQDEFFGLLRKLNDELDITLVLVSHDTERVVKEAMHVACIDRELTFHESPEEFLRHGHAVTHHRHAR